MITKSHYVTYCSCPRCLFYSLNNKDKARALSLQEQNNIKEGLEVGKVACGYFNNTIKVKENTASVSPQVLAELTTKLLKDNPNCLAEASFIYQNLFCAVDLLVKDKDGYSIYEVKATKHPDDNLDDYASDVAFQKYVLEHNNLKINHCYILYLNGEYVRHGKIDPQQLFSIYEIDQEAEFDKAYDQIESNLKQLRQILTNKQVPDYGNCSKDCQFFKFCHANLPEQNILQLSRINLKKAHTLINKGVRSFADYKKEVGKATAFQAIQLSTGNQPHVDVKQIKVFLDSLHYPLYHLDFETTMAAIPPCDGLKPYQQLAYQYSLHIENSPGAKCIHKEYLAEQYDDEYQLAKQLIKDIPPHAMVAAFHVSTEQGIIKKLAERFPDLKDQLLVLTTNMVDLIKPFTNGYYYNSKQKGVNSIKAVMPALCPDLEHAYHNLPLIHNGGEALAMFPLMLKMNGKERQQTRQGMLEYCKLDTYSMVKVLNALWKLVK